MADLIESIKSNPIVYYVGLLVGLFLLSLIIYFIVKNDKKKKQLIKEKEEEKARVERHVDLETMIAKMQEQEQNKMKNVDPVVNFEQEQEEKAIISYQELVNAVKTEQKEPINVINVSSNGNIISTPSTSKSMPLDDKPIFIDEIDLAKSEMEFDPQGEAVALSSTSEEINRSININKDLDKPISEVKETNDDLFNNILNDKPKEEKSSQVDLFSEIKEINVKPEKTKTENFKFKNSEFISPIYGRQNSNITYPKIASFKEEMLDDDIINISSDVDPNDEFLKTLREFRNN